MKRMTSHPSPGRRAAIRLTRRYGAPPQRVFDAWLDPAVAHRWLFATATRPLAQAEIDPRVAGAFRLVDRRPGVTVEHTGRYLAIVPHRHLAFTLSSDGGRAGAPTRVTVDIAPLARGCELTLTHEDLPPGMADRAEARWTGILYGLGVTLDGGLPTPASRRRVDPALARTTNGKRGAGGAAPRIPNPKEAPCTSSPTCFSTAAAKKRSSSTRARSAPMP